MNSWMMVADIEQIMHDTVESSWRCSNQAEWEWFLIVASIACVISLGKATPSPNQMINEFERASFEIFHVGPWLSF